MVCVPVGTSLSVNFPPSDGEIRVTCVPIWIVAVGIGWVGCPASTSVPVTPPRSVTPWAFGFSQPLAPMRATAAIRPRTEARVMDFVYIFRSMSPYGPVAIYLAVAFLASLAFCLLPGLVARKKPNAVKSQAYECGVEPTSDVSGRFPVRFYLIAMLFVIFDVEAASFYPWAVQMHQLRVFGLLEMLMFVVVLAIGYAYVWKRGGFQWR